MLDDITQKADHEKALLVGMRTGPQTEAEINEYLDELAALVDTYGAVVLDKAVVRLSKPNPRYLMGAGNAEELSHRAKELQANLIVFDEELSPSQQRNWEQLTRCRCVDRQEIILDIFSHRATTKEAELQIELAQSEYMLPRLKRAWTHLSRQQGGVGVRGGEGEKQIEIDSRLVRRRIAHLKEELRQVEKRRAEQRKKRRKRPVPNAAIVGYTNAGKSSLFNKLTQSEVLVEDKLFATLDPTTRRLILPNNQVLLLTDTVGFVRKLPHGLVEAFKATLEEAVIADYVIHVVDASSPLALEHYETTLRVLEEIGAENARETLTIFNKIDLVEHKYEIFRLRRRFPEALFVSVHTGEGLDEVIAACEQLISHEMQTVSLCIPQERYDLVAWLHRECLVEEERHEHNGVYLTASVPVDRVRDLACYLENPEDAMSQPEMFV